MKQLTLDNAPNTPPIWCSMCGAVLTPDDHPCGLCYCQCAGCREVLQARVRRIMGASGNETINQQGSLNHGRRKSEGN